MFAQRDVFGLLSAHRQHFDYLFKRFPLPVAEAPDAPPTA